MNAKFMSVLLIFSLFAFMQCNGQKKGEKDAKTTIEGEFTSKKGVMHTISCYCYNVGFLETDDAKHVICFDRMKLEKAPKCKKISVKGYFEKHTVKEESGSPCPGGERDIFYVESFECQD